MSIASTANSDKISCHRLSIKKTTQSAFDGARRFLFFVRTSPAIAKRRSLGTEVAGMANIRRATAATDG